MAFFARLELSVNAADAMNQSSDYNEEDEEYTGEEENDEEIDENENSLSEDSIVCELKLKRGEESLNAVLDVFSDGGLNVLKVQFSNSAYEGPDLETLPEVIFE